MESEELKALYIYEHEAENKGCIIFDVGVHYPYRNVEDLIFDFSIDGIKTDDKRLFRDYDRNYLRYGKTYEKKINVLGYPVVDDIRNLNRKIQLSLTIGFQDEKVSFSFPLLFQLNDKKPLSCLKIRYMFDDRMIVFESSGLEEDGEFYRRIWINEPEKDYINMFKHCDLTILSIERNMHEQHSFVAQDLLIPVPQNRERYINC